MQIVFATGQPGEFKIHIVPTRKMLPSGARVLATCSGGSVVELLDRSTFHAMTNKEFYALQVSIGRARQLEAERYRRTRNNALDRILRRLLAR